MMKVATEPYGKAEFNYPEVKLMPFAAGSNVKIIGDEEQKEQENVQKQDNTAPLDEQSAQTAKEAVQNVVKTINNNSAEKKSEPVKQTQPLPLTAKPASVPKPAVIPQKPVSAPIPMAVPETLH